MRLIFPREGYRFPQVMIQQIHRFFRFARRQEHLNNVRIRFRFDLDAFGQLLRRDGGSDIGPHAPKQFRRPD